MYKVEIDGLMVGGCVSAIMIALGHDIRMENCLWHFGEVGVVNLLQDTQLKHIIKTHL